MNGMSGGRNSVDFACAASQEPPATELVERKVCEGLCGGCFYRPVPATARGGQKLCAACERIVRKQRSTVNASRLKDLFGTIRKYPKAS